jgi:ABC-type branched-subunit amino acid transport system substrate-binding protein
MCAALALALVGCSDDGTGQGAITRSTTSLEPETTAIPTGKLAGMQGTTPLSEVSDDFVERLATVDPDLADKAYAAEAYDTTVIIALATELARTDAPGRFAGEIIPSTRFGAKCTVWKACTDLTDKLADIDYDGVSGAIEMLTSGEPGEASFGVMQFDAQDQLEKVALRTATALDPGVTVAQADPNLGPDADGVLKIGMLLPKSGSEVALGDAQRAGVRLAVKEINEEGGVLGRPVELVDADAGTPQDDLALESVTTLLEEGVDAIIGPTSSETALQVIDPITSAGVVLFSPSVSSRLFSQYPTRGLFFRLAPSDVLQGQVLADVAAGDGITSVLVLAQKGTYGDGVTLDFATAFQEASGRISAIIRFDPTTLDPAVISAALAAPADGVVMFGDPEPVGAIITSMATAGRGPEQLPYYMGNISNTLAQYVR